MIFTTFWFLIFLSVSALALYASPFPAGRPLILLAASVLFYVHFAGPGALALLIALAITTYSAAQTKRKWLINLGCLLCAGSLMIYKYTGFLFDNLKHAIPSLPINRPVSVAFVAPLGISYFVFQFIHYLYDVKSGDSPIKNPLDFLHFALFFPTIAAGPIKRYQQFIPSLHKGLHMERNWAPNVTRGLLRIASGIAKKLVADNISLYLLDKVPNFAVLPLATRWLIFAEIAIRVYFDFSGYSDMAIGIAGMIGIEIPENFNWPYLATSITDFWRRWHISLTRWLRDYIFFPLGGNWTGGAPRHCMNLLIVFLVCGLWHGAAWGFILWGLYHGFGMVIHYLITRRSPLKETATNATVTTSRTGNAGPSRARSRLSPIRIGVLAFNWALTTLFVWSGWLLFFYPPRQALSMFVSMFHA